MALEVIGAGFGRTGTMSLKQALEQLGVAPCYHMMEVRENPGHDALWLAATRGEAVDWDALFGRYRAAVDWPTAAFWPQLAAHYPDAKIILTVRPGEDWYRSVASTIYPIIVSTPQPGGRVSVEHRTMTRELIAERTFGGRFEDRAHALAVYARNIAAVCEQIEPARLLVYEAGAGWEPLCAFLERPVPAEPYPHTNSTEEFQRIVAERAAEHS